MRWFWCVCVYFLLLFCFEINKLRVHWLPAYFFFASNWIDRKKARSCSFDDWICFVLLLLVFLQILRFDWITMLDCIAATASIDDNSSPLGHNFEIFTKNFAIQMSCNSMMMKNLVIHSSLHLNNVHTYARMHVLQALG